MENNNIPSPFPPPLTPPNYGNLADAIPKMQQQAETVAQASAMLPSLQSQPQLSPAQAPVGASQTPPQRKITTTQPDDYFTKGIFGKEVRDYQACASRVTGYKTLDAMQPFYPGFYCIGAISSLGKTTFCQQMADQIAAAGFWVLYFSLEQSHFELFSKSLARGFYKTNRADTRKNNRPSTYPTPSSIDIRRGLTSSCPQEMAAQIDSYIQATQNRIYVIDGAFSLTVEDIRGIVDDFINLTGESPVVIVDYLQIIAPSLINGRVPDTKTSIDHIVHALKVMQTDYNLSALAISSLNRSNYTSPVDFESFKESGGIEYTADVIWGLQLSVLNSREFYHHYDNNGKQKGETTMKEKREMINLEKAKSPRSVDLVCLKNRYGISNYSLPFEYYPASDYFCPPYNPNNSLTWP